MRVRFRELWLRCGAKSDSDAAYNYLESRYAEPHRAYHTF
jgi:hypothetical protein